MKTYNKRLYKSDENKIIFGVFGGLGEYFDIDPMVFRVAYILITVFGVFFPGIIAYVLVAMIVPNKPKMVYEKGETPPNETVYETAHEVKNDKSTNANTKDHHE